MAEALSSAAVPTHAGEVGWVPKSGEYVEIIKDCPGDYLDAGMILRVSEGYEYDASEKIKTVAISGVDCDGDDFDSEIEISVLKPRPDLIPLKLDKDLLGKRIKRISKIGGFTDEYEIGDIYFCVGVDPVDVGCDLKVGDASRIDDCDDYNWMNSEAWVLADPSDIESLGATTERSWVPKGGDTVEGTCEKGSPYAYTVKGWRGKITNTRDVSHSTDDIYVVGIDDPSQQYWVCSKYFKKVS